VTQIARIVQLMCAVLTTYGATYGIQISNLVFVVSALLLLLLTAALWSRDRDILAAVWPALLGLSLPLALMGLPTLGRPECTPTQSGASPGGCVNAASRFIDLAALLVASVAIVAAVTEWRRDIGRRVVARQ
jgi:hypothetical protein